MQKFWLFFYGLPNIFGLAFMALGLVITLAMLLLFNGNWVFWLLLLPFALYILGWLAGYIVQPANAQLRFQQNLTAEQLTEALNELLNKVRHRIDADSYQHLENIQRSVQSVLPHIASGEFANHDLFTVKKTILDYLPTTLENYLKLPTTYANRHVINNGKTAKVLLNEQLTMIDNTLTQVVNNIYSQDAEALLVNERFLQTRLQSIDFLGNEKAI